jgi:hypothetical protein
MSSSTLSMEAPAPRRRAATIWSKDVVLGDIMPIEDL